MDNGIGNGDALSRAVALMANLSLQRAKIKNEIIADGAFSLTEPLKGDR